MVPASKILDEAREWGADIIGLSGLITPSLDQMVHMAKEMERLGLHLPLLVGGATTSRTHTAVRIEPAYTKGPTLHVEDASRCIPAVAALLNEKEKDAFAAETRESYRQLRERYGKRAAARKFLPIREARARRFPIDWGRSRPPRPAFLGVQPLENLEISELVDTIDWGPFLQTWEIRGRWPELLDDPRVGPQAGELVEDARALLDRIVEEGLLSARGVMGFFPAAARGDDAVLFTDESRSEVLAVVPFLRQQFDKGKRGGESRPNVCLSDFLAPEDSAISDWMGAFAVTAGHGLEALVREYEEDQDDYWAIMAKALADRLAESFAERLHQRVRAEYWGYAPEDADESNKALIAEQYHGIRPAPGYPACPDHTGKQVLFDLLDAPGGAGMALTESCAMTPAASVSGWYFSHPESFYFGVGKVGRDQVEDYARRTNRPLLEVEGWLAPNLGYERDTTP